jgi:hypothetical protein
VWCNAFRDGRTALNDYPEIHRRGSGTLHTDENCVTIEGFIREDQTVKAHETAEVIVIAKTVHEILSDINFCKMSGRWFQKCSPKSTKAKDDYVEKINISMQCFLTLLQIPFVINMSCFHLHCKSKPNLDHGEQDSQIRARDGEKQIGF